MIEQNLPGPHETLYKLDVMMFSALKYRSTEKGYEKSI